MPQPVLAFVRVTYRCSGLRLRPPVYNLITREAAEDTELDGVSIPKGTGAPCSCLHSLR